MGCATSGPPRKFCGPREDFVARELDAKPDNYVLLKPMSEKKSVLIFFLVKTATSLSFECSFMLTSSVDHEL